MLNLLVPLKVCIVALAGSNRSGPVPKTAVLSGGFRSLIVKRSSSQYTLLRALVQEKKYAHGIVHQHFSAYFLSEDKALFEREPPVVTL